MRHDLTFESGRYDDTIHLTRPFPAAILIFNVFCALQGPRYVNIEEHLIAINRDRPGSVTNASSGVLRRESFKSIIAVYEAIKGAGNGYESSIDAIIARSAKNNYRNILAHAESDDFAWVQSYLKDRPIGPLVMVPMLQAAVEHRCKLAARVSALTAKKRRPAQQTRGRTGQARGRPGKTRESQRETHHRAAPAVILARIDKALAYGKAALNTPAKTRGIIRFPRIPGSAADATNRSAARLGRRS